MNRNNKKFYDSLTVIHTAKADPNTVFKAVRRRGKDYREVVKVYIDQKGEPIKKVLEVTLSQMGGKMDQITDYGVTVSHPDRAEVLMKINDFYKDITVLDTVTGLGWQYSDTGKVISFVCSKWVGRDGTSKIHDPEDGLPEAKGTTDVSKINDYMKGCIERQIILLYGLSAPIAGLMEECLILSLSGKSSTGKTTAAMLAMSQSCSPDYLPLSKTMNVTGNALEKTLGGIYGMGILLDDTSLTNKKFNLEELIYRLHQGRVKGRMDRNFNLTRSVTNGEDFHTTFIFTTEIPILSKTDAKKEGVNGRVVEIAVREGSLFNDEKQCREMKRYASDNYGNVLPRLVKRIFKLGIKKVRKMVEDEEDLLMDTLGAREPVVKRHDAELSILRTTANLANKHLGYEFDIDGITNFIIENVKASLEDTRQMQPAEQVMKNLYPNMDEGCKYSKEVDDKRYCCIKYNQFKKLVAEYCEGVSPTEAEKILWENHILCKGDEGYSTPQNVNGISRRGLWFIKKEDD